MKRVTFTDDQYEVLVMWARVRLEAAQREWHPAIAESEAMVEAIQSAEDV